jgi:osmotically-inducible protein OsmY
MGHRAARGARLFVAVLAVAAAGCAGDPPRSANERVADEELVVRVDEALHRDPAVYARHVEVDVRRGVVRLSGFVLSSDDLYEARRVAANVPGVRGVVSELELMVGGRAGAR